MPSHARQKGVCIRCTDEDVGSRAQSQGFYPGRVASEAQAFPTAPFGPPRASSSPAWHAALPTWSLAPEGAQPALCAAGTLPWGQAHQPSSLPSISLLGLSCPLAQLPRCACSTAGVSWHPSPQALGPLPCASFSVACLPLLELPELLWGLGGVRPRTVLGRLL